MTKTMLSLVTVLMLTATALPAKAESAFTEAQKKELEAMFKEYLLNNGGDIMQSVQKFQEAEAKKQLETAKENITKNSDYLYNSGSPSTGPADADVTVVEFFDYNCGYCKKAVEEVKAVLGEDKKVKFVFKEMPILSPSSREAAQWALAADKQGKYFEYHVALMEFKGEKDAATLKKLAEGVGLDVAKLEKDKDLPEIAAMIDKNLEMSQQLGVRGTPAFIIGQEFSPGYIQLDQMKAMIKAAREKKG